MEEPRKKLREVRKKLDKLWNETPKIKKEYDYARPTVEMHINEFNKHTRSKIDLERFKIPSETVVFKVMDKLEMKNPNFNKAKFLQAFRKIRKYFEHMRKIEKATKELVKLEEQIKREKQT